MSKKGKPGRADLEPREWLAQFIRDHREQSRENAPWSTDELIIILEAYDDYLTGEAIRIMTEASIEALKEKRK